MGDTKRKGISKVKSIPSSHSPKRSSRFTSGGFPEPAKSILTPKAQQPLTTRLGVSGQGHPSESSDEEDNHEDTDSIPEANIAEDEGDTSEERDSVDGELSHALHGEGTAYTDEAVALDEISDREVDEDMIPKQKVVINNELALKRIREAMQLDPSLLWTETLVTTSNEALDVVDADDDLQRELAFYKQALSCAQKARSLAAKHNLPFTRPSDYYAEMVKSDAHMERIRMKLLDETAGITKSEEAKKQRDLKKYGKEVQVQKLKERVKEKKAMEERVKNLKRKRKGALDDPKADDEAFDIALEDAITDRPSKKPRADTSKMPRSRRDNKFRAGGGGGRRSKQNTRESTNNFEFGGGKGRFGANGKKGGDKNKRLGKSRREKLRH